MTMTVALAAQNILAATSATLATPWRRQTWWFSRRLSTAPVAAALMWGALAATSLAATAASLAAAAFLGPVTVDGRPRGPVPVLALEWQIGQEVPNNLAAVKKAAEMMGTDAAWVRRRLDESARFRVAKAAEAAAATAGPGGASPAAQADWGNAAAVMSRVNGNGPALMTAATAGATGTAAAASAAEGRSPPRADWEKDETLEAYIQKISKGSK